MGCGGCAAVCPSGAMTYAFPRVSDLGTRLKTLLATYSKSGGSNACVLFHNTN
jgi:ferredoxin